MTLKICVAQLNFVVGDMAGNARRIIEAAGRPTLGRTAAADA
jgi:NAD+ synthase (glutamine-hydrolysing)